MEGPRNKLVTFVGVRAPDCDLRIPQVAGDASYLGGHTLAELLEAERLGTTEALAAGGRPSLSIEIERLDAPGLGELLMLYQVATALAGELYGIDAFNQPGVELGKRLAYGLLGRAGFEQAAEQIRAARKERPERYRA
jgi:glucose-6-phosphate isomerase